MKYAYLAAALVFAGAALGALIALKVATTTVSH